MIAFSTGKTLTKGDLSIYVRDQQGNPVAPTSISFSIFSTSSQPPQLVMGPKLNPAADLQNTGYFFIDITLPTNWTEGNYRLVWYLQQYPDSPEVTIYEDFAIVKVDVPTSSLEAPSMVMAKALGISEKAATLLVYIRELLSDTNPDRNYHFRPPTAGKTIAEFSQRVGYIWLDQSLLRFANLAIARINSANPMNFYSFTLETIPDSWFEAAAVGAAYMALMAEAIRWNAEEFSYSLNGVSIDINKASGYQGLAEAYRTEFTEWAIALTANRPYSAAVRQNRWLIG